MDCRGASLLISQNMSSGGSRIPPGDSTRALCTLAPLTGPNRITHVWKYRPRLVKLQHNDALNIKESGRERVGSKPAFSQTCETSATSISSRSAELLRGTLLRFVFLELLPIIARPALFANARTFLPLLIGLGIFRTRSFSSFLFLGVEEIATYTVSLPGVSNLKKVFFI